MANIQIIIGSVMGTAFQVAETAQRYLEDRGHTVILNPAFQAGDLKNPDEILLVCTSNTGMGDLPDNIRPFHVHLINDLPPLFERRFALVNLGDSSYPNFAQAGKTLEHALQEVGAQPIQESLVMDAIMVDDYQSDAIDWLKTFAIKVEG